jgi:hypothetical protein
MKHPISVSIKPAAAQVSPLIGKAILAHCGQPELGHFSKQALLED